MTSPVYLAQFLEDQLPAFLPEGLDSTATIKDPTAVLRAQTAAQTISETVVIVISTATTAADGSILNGISNIPFVQKNANAVQMDAIFWIETVELPGGQLSKQLQYVQRVILDFLTAPGTTDVIHWPYISLAILVKQ